MKASIILFILAMICGHLALDKNVNYFQLTKELRKIQQKINHKLMDSYGHDPDTPAQVLFKDKTFVDEFNGMPILVWQIDFPSHTIGNHLGTYFDSIACAHATGMHFIGLSPRHDPNEPFHTAFPHIIPHLNPLPNNRRDLWEKEINAKCSCDRYCWVLDQPWEDYIPQIRRMMLDASRLHVLNPRHGYLPEYLGMPLSNETDLYTVPQHSYLPLFPDVAVHYRCVTTISLVIPSLMYSS